MSGRKCDGGEGVECSFRSRSSATVCAVKAGLPQHKSTADSMVYWLETVTAVGVRLEADDSLTVIAPLGTDDPLGLYCRPTPFGRTRLDEYNARVASKRWRELWPKVLFES